MQGNYVNLIKLYMKSTWLTFSRVTQNIPTKISNKTRRPSLACIQTCAGVRARAISKQKKQQICEMERE